DHHHRHPRAGHRPPREADHPDEGWKGAQRPEGGRGCGVPATGADCMMAALRIPFALLMLFYQSIVLALSQIWANKIRGILTTVGIMIGVAAVSAVIALITGMEQRVMNAVCA